MRKIALMAMVLVFAAAGLSAQDITVDEILENYFENTGGLENWKALKGVKMTAKLNQGGMEIPLEIVQMSDGRTYTKFSLQGTEIYQGVFDGETLWGINFQNMQAEKSDAETTANYKLNINDFPDSFIDYEEKGYTVELLGTETIDGAETYKVKLVKEPITINGEEQEDVTYYYFDTEAFIPIAQDTEVKQGPQAGIIQRITQSDFDEVEGLYFPFSMTQGVKDGPSQPISIESIEVNPEVDESVFKFPGE
ncbi:MAG: outer membrane lipoprotein-sorting protein [Rickettsiales bacterium]|nr:outer membrane lipoprotein-sorting protein [Rickettsiales bacterium]